MKTYYGRVPFAGVLLVSFESDAEVPADAIPRMLYEKASSAVGRVELKPTKISEAIAESTDTEVELEGWDLYEHLFEGNISYVELDKAELDYFEEDEDDPEEEP
jgi:hypothetical protein